MARVLPGEGDPTLAPVLCYRELPAFLAGDPYTDTYIDHSSDQLSGELAGRSLARTGSGGVYLLRQTRHASIGGALDQRSHPS